MKQFPWNIELNDNWFEFDYNKFKEALDTYHTERRKLENLTHEATKPVPCRSWVEDYYYGSEPSYQAKMWVEINNYIEDNEKKEGWDFADLIKEKIDVNTDPYEDYEQLTTKYTVYATVENEEDFTQCEEYQTQYKYVEQLYKEVMEYKGRIDKKLETNNV